MIVKTIPFSKDFKITEFGEVYDKNGKPRNTYLNGDGYLTTAILNSNNRWETFGVHRLVALTFNAKEMTTDRNQVNHIDGDKRNNHYTNLDWCTVRENTLHDSLLNGTSRYKKIVVLDANGFERTMANLKDASEYTGSSIRDVWFSIKNKTKINSFTVKPLIDHKVNRKKLLGQSLSRKRRPIDLYNIYSKEKHSFDTIADAAKFLGCTTNNIATGISDMSKQHLLMEEYIAVEKGNDIPNIGEDELITMTYNRGKEVIAKCIKTNVKHLFPSAAYFIRSNNLSKKIVATNLKKKRLVEHKGWVFSYVEDYGKHLF